MSHEITVANGVAEAYYAAAPAWHRLGQVVAEAQNSAEVIKLAHLDWEVTKQPLFTRNVTSEEISPVADRFVTMRSDNNQQLGIVGNTYSVLQNADAFSILDALIANGDLLYESAGSLKGGNYVWMLARFPKEFYVSSDDPCQNYVLLVNTHDGSKKLTVLPTNVRVVCWNTLSYALSDAKTQFLIKHSGSMNGHIEEMQKFLGIMNSTNQQIESIMKELAQRPVDTTYVDGYIETMFPILKVKTEEEALASTRLKNIRSIVQANFDNMDTIASRNTRFGLFNAITEYVDHQRTTHGKDDANIEAGNRFNSIFFGSGNELKQKAFKLIQK